MREIPVLYSIPMVRAILAEIKTLTRRTQGLNHINMDPDDWKFIGKQPEFDVMYPIDRGKRGEPWFEWGGRRSNSYSFIAQCPYGTKGDILWVKETHYRFGRWKKNGLTEKGRQKWKFAASRIENGIKYFDNPPELVRRTGYRKLGWYKRNSLFMPKALSRIRLQVINVRVERLQDISRADAIKEGIEQIYLKQGLFGKELQRPDRALEQPPENCFEHLWQTINGEKSWKKNPWIWVVEFKAQSISISVTIRNRGKGSKGTAIIFGSAMPEVKV